MKKEILEFVHKLGKELVKKSPGILTGIGAGGVIGTAYLASKATLEAKDKVKPEMSFKEKAKVVAPIYLPTVIVGATSICCIFGAQSIGTRRQAALASAYSISEMTRKEFQEKAEEVFGEKKVEKVKDQIAEEKIKKAYSEKKDNVIETGKGDQLFMDLWSGQVFRSDIEHIRRTINDANEELNSATNVFLNDLYDAWKIHTAKFGELFGWDINFTGIIKPKFIPVWVDEEHTQTCTGIDWYVDPALVAYE